MKSMKLMSLAAVAAGAVAISACGNGNGLLGGGNNSSSMNAEQTAAVQALAESDGHWCESCETPADGAEHLEVGIMPAEYAGGPLELIVSFVSPAGVVGADGAWRVEKTLTMNDVDLLASVPDAGWAISNDGKRARIRFESSGLPVGVYVVRGSITDPDLGSADNSRTYTVAEHNEEPTPTPSGDHTPEPTPTPSGDHTPEPTPTPGPDATPTI